MRENGKRMISNSGSNPSVSALLVISGSFILGTILCDLFISFLPLRLPLFFSRFLLTSYPMAFLCWTALFLLPCFLAVFFSTSSLGAFCIPILFFVVGSVISLFYKHLFQNTGMALPIFFLPVFPVLVFLPALFLLGEFGFQRSCCLLRFSRSGSFDNLPAIPGARYAVAFAFISIAAFIQLFIVPYYIKTL